MKKNSEKTVETAEEKENRWKKESKAARSFARQCGIKIKKKEKTLSEQFDY